MAKQDCEKCKFYMGASDLRDPSITGICRRYPPQPVAYRDEEQHVETVVWPMVNGGEWCGEFSKA